MVGLDLKKPFSESVAPNQDAVRDAVNPLKGLQDVSVAIGHATKVLEDMRRASVYSEANTQFSSISAESDKSFMDYTNSLDMRNAREAGDKINTYVDGALRKNYANFISTIPNREVRQHFQLQAEHDLRLYQKKGLEIQIGAVVAAQTENVNIATGYAADSVRRDPSNESHSRQIESIGNHINSLPIGLVEKQKLLNQAQEKIHTNQIIGAYAENPKAFEGFITASYKGVSSPENPHSIADVADSAGERELVVNDDVSKSINLNGWDRLDDTKRRHLLEHLTNRDNAANTKQRVALSSTLKSHDVLFDQGVMPKDVDTVALDDCTRLFGADKGIEIYALHQFKKQLVPEVARIRLMPETEAKAFLERVAKEGGGIAHSAEAMVTVSKYHHLLSKAHTDSMQELHQDAIKWGIKHKQIDPLRFDTPENYAHSIAQRSSFVKNLKRDHGIASEYFNSSEEKLLKDQLMRRPAHESVQMYQQSYQLLSDADKQSSVTSFNRMKDNTLASVMSLSTEFGEDAQRASHTLISGAKNKEEVEKLYKAHPNSDNKAFDTHYNPLIAKQLGGVQGNSIGGSFAREAEAIKLYIMGHMKATGDYTLSKKIVADGVQMVLGNTPVSVNGSQLMPPRRMKQDEFLDRLWFATQSAGEFDPYWSHYMNVGGGRYALVEYGNPKVDKEGNPIIINPRDAPTDKLLEANKERNRERELRIHEGLVFQD